MASYRLTTGTILTKQKGLATGSYTYSAYTEDVQYGISVSDLSLENAGICKIALYNGSGSKVLESQTDLNGDTTIAHACFLAVGDLGNMNGEDYDETFVVGANTYVDEDGKQQKVFCIDATNKDDWTSGNIVIKIAGRTDAVIKGFPAGGDYAPKFSCSGEPPVGAVTGSGQVQFTIPFTGVWG